jgi:hypothetical protein
MTTNPSITISSIRAVLLIYPYRFERASWEPACSAAGARQMNEATAFYVGKD